jgi:dsRNA-specific ribonuclease
LSELEAILDYKFKNIKYLKEALIHHSYYSSHHSSDRVNSSITYEKLEALGDAVLDVIVNSSLVKFAMERKISPYEIHHSKSNLVNNDLLCRVATFYGIHRFILSGYSKYTIPGHQLQTLYNDHIKLDKSDKYPMEFFEGITDRKNTFWDHKNGKRKSKRAKLKPFDKRSKYSMLM